MKKLLFGSVAAVGMGLGLLPGSASAHWETRVSYRVDPCGCTVAHRHKVWVPDPCEPRCEPCDPCARPAYHTHYRPGVRVLIEREPVIYRR